MKGSMRERKPGVWELIVQLPRDPLTGKARQMSRSVHGTKRDAQRALAALVGQVDEEKLTSSGDSVSGLLKAWLEMKGRDLSPTTAREYQRLTTTLIAPALGNLALKDVSARRLDAFYAALLDRKNLSASSVRQGTRSCGAPSPKPCAGAGSRETRPSTPRRPRSDGRRSLRPTCRTLAGSCSPPTSTTLTSVCYSGCSPPQELAVARCAVSAGPTSSSTRARWPSGDL